jgi:hypothetical protein
MGTLYNFGCGSCGYQAEVSGGRDAGMAQLTATIACEDCQELYDVVTSEHPFNRTRVEIPLRCPKSVLHYVRLWTHPGSCPKCSASLKRERETVIWD